MTYESWGAYTASSDFGTYGSNTENINKSLFTAIPTVGSVLTNGKLVRAVLNIPTGSQFLFFTN